MGSEAARANGRFKLVAQFHLSVFLLFILLFAGSSSMAQDTTGVGAVAGLVKGVDQLPASGVTVCLTGTHRCAPTDRAGRFRLADLRAGRYRLELTIPGQPSQVSSEFEVHAGVESSLEFELSTLAPLAQTVTVTAQALPVEIKTSGYLVPAEMVQDSAGSLQDISRYLQSLPGVVMGGEEERNDLIVRGGSPLENLFIVDNIEVPNINSFANFAAGGGLVGMLDSRLLRDVTFLSGGYPASYSNRLSSVLQIGLREGDRKKCEGTAAEGFAGVGLILGCPIGKDKGSWILSARRTFLDCLQTTLVPEGCQFPTTSISRDFMTSRRMTEYGS